MKNSYSVPFAPQAQEQALLAAPKAVLQHWYPVPQGEYHPETYAQLLRTPFALYVRMVCKERDPMAVQRMPNSPVCTDSCMEFFLNPVPEKRDYINFEVNSRGVLLMGFNDGVFRCLDPALQAGCFAKAWVDGEKGEWEMRLCVPVSLLQTVFPDFKAWPEKMECNFYKCGDDTKVPHYGSWNFVDVEPISFHRPEYFGELLLERE